MDPHLEDWDAWTPEQLAARMAGVGCPWYVAGGWAVDLHVGRVTREHEDLEIAVPAEGFREVTERFPDMEFWVPAAESELVPATEASLAGESHQSWARERAAGRWRFDVFREPAEEGLWVCRRDASIRRPYSEIVSRTADGIPYLVPEVVLLFKAKAARAKDRADLDVVWPLMTREQHSWLLDALALVHPGHEWLGLR